MLRELLFPPCFATVDDETAIKLLFLVDIRSDIITAVSSGQTALKWRSRVREKWLNSYDKRDKRAMDKEHKVRLAEFQMDHVCLFSLASLRRLNDSDGEERGEDGSPG